MKKKININEIALNTRRTWGNVKPCAKVFKSKRDYNRKDNSWKKEDRNMNTHDHKDENTTEKCWLCKGYGVLPSHCDAPDRICPACDGTGKANEVDTENE